MAAPVTPIEIPEVDEVVGTRLRRFVDLLLAANQIHNLTAIRDADAAWQGHVRDSLALLPLIDDAGPARLLDLGTGGGVPGTVIARARPELAVTLLDATRKKVLAAEQIARHLDLARVAGLWGRAETLAHDAAHREQYDAVVARAVAPLAVLAELAAGFVRPGGWCWFMKTASALDEELPAARQAFRTCLLVHRTTHGYILPGADRGRIIVALQKNGRLPAKLPREPGKPAQQPL